MAERPIKIIPSATARPRLPGPQTLEGGDWISLPWEWRREGGCVPVLFSLETLGPGDHGGQILRKVGGGAWKSLEDFVIGEHTNGSPRETLAIHPPENFLAHRCLFHGDWVERLSARA